MSIGVGNDGHIDLTYASHYQLLSLSDMRSSPLKPQCYPNYSVISSCALDPSTSRFSLGFVRPVSLSAPKLSLMAIYLDEVLSKKRRCYLDTRMELLRIPIL